MRKIQRLRSRSTRLLLVAAIAVTLSCREGSNDYVAPGAQPVRTEVAKRGEFVPTLTILGVVRPAETIPLVATKGGTVSYSRRFASGLRTGEEVRAGEVLASVLNESVRVAHGSAKLQRESAEADLRRSQRSFAEGLISEAEHAHNQIKTRLAQQQLESVGRESRRLQIVVPRAGRLVVRHVHPEGSEIDAGATLAEVAVGGMPRVEAWVAATDRERLRVGQSAQIFLPGLDASAAEATVREVASVLESNGTARVVLEISSATAMPVAGAGVEVVVRTDRRPDAITVPEEALIIGGSGQSVFVLSSAGDFERGYKASRAAVTTGGSAQGRVEVMSGLRVGDRVIVSGVEAIADDARVVEVKEGDRP